MTLGTGWGCQKFSTNSRSVFFFFKIGAGPAHQNIFYLCQFWGERQSIAQKGVRVIDARNSQLENGSNIHAAKPLTLQSLLFFDFLAFFVFRFSLLFCAFFLSFPRILGVPRREKPLLFGEKPLLFPKKQGLEVQGTQCSRSRAQYRATRSPANTWSLFGVCVCVFSCPSLKNIP